MYIELIVFLILISKKCNKYVFILFLLLISYFLLYHKTFNIPNLDLYSSIDTIQLMPEIIDKVPF